VVSKPIDLSEGRLRCHSNRHLYPRRKTETVARSTRENNDMAKTKRNGSMTKADAIRSYLSSHPKAKARETVEALAAQGTKVSANHVYLIMSKGKAKVRKAKGAKLRAVAASRPSIKDYADAVHQVKMLAHQLGGLSSLKALVDALAE
jgi:hypothetical protein